MAMFFTCSICVSLRWFIGVLIFLFDIFFIKFQIIFEVRDLQEDLFVVFSEFCLRFPYGFGIVLLAMVMRVLVKSIRCMFLRLVWYGIVFWGFCKITSLLLLLFTVTGVFVYSPIIGLWQNEPKDGLWWVWDFWLWRHKLLLLMICCFPSPYYIVAIKIFHHELFISFSFMGSWGGIYNEQMETVV